MSWLNFFSTAMRASSRPASFTSAWPTHKVRRSFHHTSYFVLPHIFFAAVLSEERLAEYVGTLELYRAVSGKKRSSDLLGMAATLLAYCNTHRLDPDNSLIGAINSISFA